jgi:uncharacterized membrane protein YebE (DUF533 family)
VRAKSTAKPRLTPQEALIYAMVTVAAADRTISEHELARINTMVRELPAFHGIGESWLSHEAQNCGRVLAKPDGIQTVVGMIVDGVPESLREIRDDERNFLTLLAEGLNIDPLVRAALERSAHARHMRT